MNKLTLLLAGSLLAACTEITYKEPQPKGIKPLSEIPSNIQGVYEFGGDTITFFNHGFRAKEKDKTEEVLYMGDSIILKSYKGYYFVSYPEHNEWLLRILKPQKNGDLVYLEMENVPEDETERKIFLEKLSTEIPVAISMKDSVTRYTIDPSSKKLYSLIQKGFFKEKSILKKIK